MSKGRKTHGKIGFQDLARTISANWKTLSDDKREVYLERARVDKERYWKEKQAWQESVAALEREHSSASLDKPSFVESPAMASPRSPKSQAAPFKEAKPAVIMSSRPSTQPPQFVEPSPVTAKSAQKFPLRQYHHQVAHSFQVPRMDFEPFSIAEMKSLEHVSKRIGQDGVRFLVTRFG